MFKKQGNVFWIVVVIAVIAILWQTGIIENLTGNAPKELPLPSQMNPEDDKGRIGTYDTRFLDRCDVIPPGLDEGGRKRFLERCNMPTGYDTSDTDYMLSPSTVSRLQSGITIPTNRNTEGPTSEVDFSEKVDKSEVKKLNDEVAMLKQEIEQLKKQTPR